MPEPYRSRPQDAPRKQAAREFVYATSPRGESPGLGPIFPVLFVGGGAFVALASFGMTAPGIAAFAGVVGLGWWSHARRSSGVVLRVDGDMLLVYPWRGARKASVVALADLLDVRLDTRTTHKPQRETRPGMFAPGGMAGSLVVDVARIQLILAPGVEPVELTKEYSPHSETVEQIGKMKVFLRSRGWVPEDEREGDAGSEG